MKQKISFLLFALLLSLFSVKGQTVYDYTERPKATLDPYSYIVAEMDTSGLYFYMEPPTNLILDVECLSYDQNDEVYAEIFHDVKAVMFSYYPLVLLYLNVGEDVIKVATQINWDIPQAEMPESKVGTVQLKDQIPIRFSLKYRPPAQPQPFNKN